MKAVCLTKDRRLQRVLKRTLKASGVICVCVESASDVSDLALQKPELIIVDHGTVSLTQLEKLMAAINWETKVLVMSDWENRAESFDLLKSQRCNNILSREHPVEEDDLVVTSSKILRGDIFGLEKYVTWGTVIKEKQVSTYDEKRLAIKDVARFAKCVGCRRQMIDRIEIVVDELLMNALYDAPAMHLGKPRKDLLALATPGSGPISDKPAILRYACDGRYLVVSVMDKFGELQKNRILENMSRDEYDEKSGLRKPGSESGLGLFYIISYASRFIANIQPKIATEVICLFDLRRSKRDSSRHATSFNIFLAQSFKDQDVVLNASSAKG